MTLTIRGTSLTFTNGESAFQGGKFFNAGHPLIAQLFVSQTKEMYDKNLAAAREMYQGIKRRRFRVPTRGLPFRGGYAARMARKIIMLDSSELKANRRFLFGYQHDIETARVDSLMR